ncbi:nucleoside triphosphate pyrophosphatase [Prochlorococcus marinus]|uniref:Nucleoside triphosphate pyrophosphatase n=1 Tax=Prochlorococcus marinus (strain MIT 9211) TaxID=93059 RepID=A9BBF4_PROM4|nr:nucleoside triphosphate pyrophosphatase [Prochlorococcus marinus]ABX09166.1 Maf-like protein [Prochlorococcus marinus str. MIT 9211]
MTLILASASKARSNLLDQVNISHEVIVSDVDESKFCSSHPKVLALSLAIAKAKSVASKVSKKYQTQNTSDNFFLVLGCDSLFEFDGEIYGKPNTLQDAINRWQKMSSNSGILHTGHCLIFHEPLIERSGSKGFQGLIKEVVSTKINFAKVSDQEIKDYVDSNEPMECAGGFAIEGKGALFINSIDGCYSNVIGLSLPWLNNALNRSGLYSRELN